MNSIYWMTFPMVVFAAVGYARETATSKAAGDIEKPTTPAVQIIDRALKEEAATDNAEALNARLRGAVIEILGQTNDNHEVQSILKSILDESQFPNSLEFAKRLRAALVDSRDILTFQPVKEAELPKDFPQWTPVGEICVQRYPSYRSARTNMSGAEGAAFWTLFKHIQSNKIAMTAPVEMSYSTAQANKPHGVAMAFLYSNTGIGQTGSAGTVSVVDVPAATAVSIGVRGDINSDVVAAAQSRLKAWLGKHADEYQAAGDLRVLGYNSPMIPASKRYFEVQLPVREVEGGTIDSR